MLQQAVDQVVSFFERDELKGRSTVNRDDHRLIRAVKRVDDWLEAVTANPPDRRVTRKVAADPSRIEPEPRVSGGGRNRDSYFRGLKVPLIAARHSS